MHGETVKNGLSQFILLFENSSASCQAISVGDFSWRVIKKNDYHAHKMYFSLNFNLRETATLKAPPGGACLM